MSRYRPIAKLVFGLAISFFAISCLAMANLVAQEAAKSEIDRIPKVVAVVNGQTITRDKLGEECVKRFGSIVLDNLLNKHLILQACEASGIKITQADVNAEIARTAGKFGLSTKLFLGAIEEERGIAPEQYASEIVWPMLALRALAADKIAVDPREVEAVMDSEFGPKVQVRMIAVTQVEKARELHLQATQSPETFRRLAKEHSEDAASASVEGLLPPIRKNSGDDRLEQIAFQLKESEISPVFQVGDLHIFLQCVRQLPATPPDPQSAPLIQERIADQIRDQRLGKAAEEIFAALQAQSQVVAVVGNPELEAKYPEIAGFINNQPVSKDRLTIECINRHGKEILRGEINRLLLNNALKQSGKSVSNEDISYEVARAADAMGFIRNDGTPDTDAWLKSIMEEEGVTMDLYLQDAVWPSVALKKLVEDEVVLTEEDLKKGFEANFGSRAEVLAIVLTNQRTAEEVFRKARAQLTEQNFGELAAKYSVEPVSRSNFGKIPPLRRYSGQPTLEDAAFSLQPGEISGVIAMNDQYVILYKQGETRSVVQDFEAVRGELEKEIGEKKRRTAMQKKLDDLVKNSQIENFLDGMVQITGDVVPASAKSSGGPAPVQR